MTALNLPLPPPPITTSPTSPTTSQRLSMASTTGTSFYTARASPLTPDSLDTPTADSDSTPRPVFAKQELHLVKITSDTRVGLDSNQANSVFHAVNKTSVMHVVSGNVANAYPHPLPSQVNPIGPPPPSPPASIKQPDDPAPMHVLPIRPLKSDPTSARPTVLDDPVARSPPSLGSRGRTASVDSRETQRALPRSPPSAFPKPSLPAHHDLVHRASTDTRLSTVSARTGASSSTRAQRTLYSDGVSEVFAVEPSVYASPSGSGSPPSANYIRGHSSSLSQSQSPDSFLQPPPGGSGPHRPARRNTTGGHIRPVQSVHSYDVDADIEDDIQLQAEQIRRERKRAKAQKDAEEALTRTSSRRRGSLGKEDDNKVLVGQLDWRRPRQLRAHVQHAHRDSHCHFTAQHKYSFDMYAFARRVVRAIPDLINSIGNELTPSAKYDFKFKDYAPWVFRELREDYFQLDPADYLLSLTAKYILSELGSPGKSGSFFYFSRDYRFIIKTIRHSEHKFLLSILKEYYAHVKSNPHTLLSRFYGLHRVKLPRGRKIHFVIMNNLFPSHKDVHETYDLKGSTVGRVYSEEKAKQNPRAVLKDLNWINRRKMLELGPEKRALLSEQIRRDSEFLKTVYVMDYSLLVGVHFVQRGNRDKVRSNTLKVFSPSVPAIRRKNTQHKGARSPEAMAVKRAMRESDPKRLGSDTFNLPEEYTGDRQQFIFYQDEGGLQATDEANQATDTIYYLGIIDILTPYSTVKQLEHFWKGLKADRHKISPVPPQEYADRFFSFMKAIMRGGDGGGRFKAE
ncbi:SAICAR synthase-like protein [Boletus reticuloceps]|uniref:SAICAR synthase-like protein n=1 Tax=Boletus reticuloceps TaxID=495285 RepID=A0A8I3A9Y0_9AGAM|nr:SAICAR synthase-like protein [Boletus reticuloceps]